MRLTGLRPLGTPGEGPLKEMPGNIHFLGRTRLSEEAADRQRRYTLLRPQFAVNHYSRNRGEFPKVILPAVDS